MEPGDSFTIVDIKIDDNKPDVKISNYEKTNGTNKSENKSFPTILKIRK